MTEAGNQWTGFYMITASIMKELTVIIDLLVFNSFQPSIVFHIETVIWFALEIMPGLYIEYYTGLKWVKRVY